MAVREILSESLLDLQLILKIDLERSMRESSFCILRCHMP